MLMNALKNTYYVLCLYMFYIKCVCFLVILCQHVYARVCVCTPGIRQLQLMLLKVCLILGVEIHVNVEFCKLVEPPAEQTDDSECLCLSLSVCYEQHTGTLLQAWAVHGKLRANKIHLSHQKVHQRRSFCGGSIYVNLLIESADSNILDLPWAF